MKTPFCSISPFLAANSTRTALAAFAMVCGFHLIAFGQASNINVPGMANPWLADATTAAGGDTAPAQSPVLVTLADISEGDEIVFTAHGSVQYDGGVPTDPPDGNGTSYRSLFHLFDSSNGGPENGIAGLNAPANSLVGVFLGPNAPTPGSTPAPFFNFAPDGNVPGNIDYSSLQPAIAQPFFIGDGRDASSVQQRVKVPTGATRLFLGGMDGLGWNNNTGSFTVTVQLAGSAPEPPPHGGLSETLLTVNGSNAPSANVADTVLRFAAQQTGRPARLHVRVQASTTPAIGTSWTDVPNGTSGRMTYDASSNQFVLNTTGYPLQNGISFRAISEAPGYPDSISNVVGPFDLASGATHLGTTVLTGTANGTIADLYFRATESTLPSGVSLRIQSTATPANEASWADLSNGSSGHMQQSNDPHEFFLLANTLPPADSIYFRAVASMPGAVDSFSGAIGSVKLTGDTPPSVTVTVSPNYVLPGSGDGHDIDHSILIAAGTFHFGAAVQSNRLINSLQLQVDGNTIARFGTGAGSGVTDYGTNVIGDHVLEAVAIDDLGGKSRAGTGAIYIRVVPNGSAAKAMKTEGTNSAPAASLGGKVFTVVNSGGYWHDPATWQDSQGNYGVPGINDFAIVGAATVIFSDPGFLGFDVHSLSLSGGHLIGPSILAVHGIITISGGSFDNDMNLIIAAGAVCELINSVNFTFGSGSNGTGSLQNVGTINVHGSGNLLGVSDFRNHGILNWQTPLTIPLNAGVDPAAANRTFAAQAMDTSGTIRGVNPVFLISQDGAGIVASGGGNIVASGGGNIVASGGGNIVASGAGNIVASGGGNIVASGGGNIVATGGGNRPAGSAPSGFTQSGGETDLSSVSIVGPVTLNGGVLSGSGIIDGDLTNNGGFIAPGHAAGRLAVAGNFTQGSNGTLIVENGGAHPSEFDQLQVGGAANLGGKLDLKTINGYAPDAADTFSPLGASSVSGTFATVSSNAAVTMHAAGLLVADDITQPEPGTGQPLNISTRLQIQSGNNVLIAGFIITGPAGSTKRVLIRGIGPSLAIFGVPGTIPDPLLELHEGDGSVVTNDNWGDAPNAGEIPAGFAPGDSLESAIYVELAPGNYTAILKGAHGETGVGLAEVYDFETASAAKLVNISTRGLVNTGDNVMIGGFIIGGTEPARVLVRAIGPSLTQFGVEGALQATTLELHDANGSVISNDGWRSAQESEIIATTIPPTDDRESAILATLVPGNYTAIVRGKNDTTGVAVVEAYNLQ